MFAYCNNNPVNFSDPAGNACVSVNDVSVDFLQWLIEQGKSFLSALAAAAGAAASDGPLPFGDAVAVGIIGSWAYKSSGAWGLFGAFGAVYPGAISTTSILTTIPVSSIAEKYGKGKCIEAAIAIAELLRVRRDSYEIITIQFPGSGDRNYVYSDITGSAIAENGFHCGVLYEGNVYCNIHPYGLPLKKWLRDFQGIGMPVITPARYQSLYVKDTPI